MNRLKRQELKQKWYFVFHYLPRNAQINTIIVQHIRTKNNTKLNICPYVLTNSNSTIVNGSLLALIMVNNSTDIGRSLSSISNTFCLFTRCFYSHIQSKRIVKQRRNSWHKFQAELYCTHTGKHVLVLSSTNALNDDNFTKTIEYQCNLQFCKLTKSEMENTIFLLWKWTKYIEIPVKHNDTTKAGHRSIQRMETHFVQQHKYLMEISSCTISWINITLYQKFCSDTKWGYHYGQMNYNQRYSVTKLFFAFGHRFYSFILWVVVVECTLLALRYKSPDATIFHFILIRDYQNGWL